MTRVLQLPVPEVVREFAWREAHAGSAMSQEDLERLAKQGMKTRPGLPGYDSVKLLCHFVRITSGLMLQDFESPPKCWTR